MRILAMVHAYAPHHNAGGELTIHALLRHLAGRGHDVHVQLSRDDGPTSAYVIDGVQVHPYDGPGSVMPYFTVPAERADVAICHLENTLRAAALCGIYRVPLAQLIHNDHTFTRGAYVRGPTQLAVFNTHWMRETYHETWQSDCTGPPPPDVVVHPPVNPADYTTPHGKRITLVNLNADKGGALFWELARQLPDKLFLGVEGAYGEQIDEGPLDNTVVYGHLPPTDMRDVVYGQTKILLMPSSYESYGRTAIEAACSGIPTIAHPTPGLREALGNSGVFVDRDNPEGWVAAIRYLSSPRGYANASRKARERAAALTTDADLDRFADAMEGVVRRGFATRIG